MYWPLDHSRAPRITLSITHEALSGKAGPGLVAFLACFLDLPARIAHAVHVKIWRRRRSDAALADFLLLMLRPPQRCRRHRCRSDGASCGRSGDLALWPPARRIPSPHDRAGPGRPAGLGAPDQPVRSPAAGAQLHGALGQVPVFLDGTGVEVEEPRSQRAGRGNDGERQYQLHAVFVGELSLSVRPRSAGPDLGGGLAGTLGEGYGTAAAARSGGL